jgi:MFS family permease
MSPNVRPSNRIENVSVRSRASLNLANFFLAETVGVVMPFLGDFLSGQGWRYDSIGVAIACSALGTFLMQTPAGMIVDRVRSRRQLLAMASLAVGLCFGLLPLFSASAGLVDSLVFAAGAASSFFNPLLGALALGLVGYEALSRTIGMNQSWNHAGNIAAAAASMALVVSLGISSVFFAVLATSLLAAACVLSIRSDEIDESRAAARSSDSNDGAAPASVRTLLHDPRILTLFAATALFHLANAPVMPTVAMYVKRLHGSDRQVAAVVLVAQTVMVPVALLTGVLCERFGRKPVFAVAFLVLPIRIFLYGLARSPAALVALQALDGIGAGIYGVVIVAICADLTRGSGRFNTLSGLIATALSLGGVVGPVASGLIVQHLGFIAAFDVFASIAAAAAALFVVFMPETMTPQLPTVGPHAKLLPSAKT